MPLTPASALLTDRLVLVTGAAQGIGAAVAGACARFGADLTAILITADRSPRVREDARANGIQVLNKPLKPAALRALLTQWRIQRVIAAE